jgi:hypothetical protein
MELIKEKLSNGNEIEYKIINGTAYHINTPDRVVNILEQSLNSKRGQRIRIFYGDEKTGRDWLEEHDTIGFIGRSTGSIKIPLLIKTSNSYGGGALLDDNIVKITIDKTTVYQHPNYHTGSIEIKDKSVFVNGENVANFNTIIQAQNYVEFLKGNRNKI